MVVPLQVPGAPELLVMLFVVLILAAFLVAIVFVVRRLRGPDAETVKELERRVDDLESKVEE